MNVTREEFDRLGNSYARAVPGMHIGRVRVRAPRAIVGCDRERGGYRYRRRTVATVERAAMQISGARKGLSLIGILEGVCFSRAQRQE